MTMLWAVSGFLVGAAILAGIALWLALREKPDDGFLKDPGDWGAT